MKKISIFKYCASLALGLALSSNLCASYTIETFVGDGTTGLSGDGGPATTASLNFTQSVCVDSLGNIYAADTNNNRIRKINSDGIISTIAGTGTYGYSGDGGLATNAALRTPYSICVDSSNNLYFSDFNNSAIRMISPSGLISTIAGTGTAGYSGDGGAATAAMLRNPFGVFVDSTGYIYVADSGNNRVRRFTLGGAISTLAGDGNATTLNNPTSVYVDNAGRVYISETGNNRIRMFDGGALTTVAGGGTGGDGGLATSARLSGPRGIFGDSAGNIYFADTTNQRIRRFTPGGIINTFAGNGTAGFSGDGGSATAAALRNPFGVFVSNTGSIYIADTFNNRIRRFDVGGNITTIAGDGTTGASGDGGIITYADLNLPRGGSFDSTGNLYFADTLHNRIRKIAAGTKIISTIAGSGIYGFSGDGGPATAAVFNTPQGVYLDGAGAIYIADTNNNRIRKIDAGSNIISTIAGGGSPADNLGDGLSATSARLASPQSVFVDSSGAIYIADTNNNRIRKIAAGSNIISTIAGTGTAGFSGDGGLSTAARLVGPQAVFVDSSGAIYIADAGNSRIRKITAGSNIISTIAGNGTAGFSGDGGVSTAAMINSPRAIFQDSSGDIYIADAGNNRIRKIAAGSNIISTIAGTGTAGFSGDGGLSTAAMISSPRAIFQDSSGRIYLSDSNNNRIRRLALTAPATSLTIEVNGTDSAIVSAALAATTVHKTGAGTSVLSGDNSGISTLEIDAGLVKVSATNNMGASLAFAGGNMEVTSGTVAVPTAAMNQAGTITTNTGAAVSSIAAPSGAALLTIAGSGVVTAGDMSSSSTPLSIPGVMYVGASSTSKMPTGVATVPNGGLLKLMGNTASSVPGDTQLQSGAVLEVADSVTVPAHTGADIFGTLKFDSGASLKLGVGSTWARNISVGTAL